jgi:ferredoxin-NADP reductase/Na+-translocating ferredoxin:NAD+ oxidoreductase RnfD subunit
MNFIDTFLNRITMYRLVMYYLMILVGVAAVFGAAGWLPYNPFDLLFEGIFLLVACWSFNGIIAWTFRAHPNSESAYITALILTLIVTPQPPSENSYIVFLIILAASAMGAKYILAINRKHIFNPAAFAVAASAILSGPAASWWVGGNLPLMAFVLAGGFLVVRKIQRFDLVLTFLGAAFLGDILTHLQASPWTTIQQAVLHTPIFFFASIMITEPLTTPPTRIWRIEYAALVGFLFSPAVHLGAYYSTPELALLAGNLFSWAVSPKRKYLLTFAGREPVGGGTIWDFAFATRNGAPLGFAPGQYLEWTLADEKTDGRGNRRTFTIASSPTEPDVHLGVRFYDPSSSFKKRLLALEPGDTIVAGHLAGDFTLPRDPSEKLVFIAGGIGITPFRSMVKYMSDTTAHGDHAGEPKRDAILLYSNRRADDIAYADVFDEAAETFGMKTLYALTGQDAAEGIEEIIQHAGQRGAPAYGGLYEGRINAELIKQEIPDWHERTFYVSGTRAMTSGMQKLLIHMGVSRTKIKVDFFPGFG